MKQKIIIIIIILTGWNITAKAQFGGGDGTESSPYEIYTKAHLGELADYVNAGNDCHGEYFIQKQDINEPVTKMIGFFRAMKPHERLCFSGNYNGNLYKINLAIEYYLRTDRRK